MLLFIPYKKSIELMIEDFVFFQEIYVHRCLILELQ